VPQHPGRRGGVRRGAGAAVTRLRAAIARQILTTERKLMHGLPTLSIVDVVSLSLISLSALRGYLRGLSGELAQLIGATAAFVLGVYLLGPLGTWCIGHTRLSPMSARAVAFVATVAGVIAVMVLIRMVLKRVMKVVFHQQAFDRFGGLAAGFARAVVVLAIVFLAMNLAPHDYLNRKFGEESVLGTLLLRAMPSLRGATPAAEEQPHRGAGMRRPGGAWRVLLFPSARG
jgi:uncharacterized membrane protein required for colicin V production